MLRFESPGLVVWTAHPEHFEGASDVWIGHANGNIETKNPDRETCQKMFAMAQVLKARVQGDDGELYDADGGPVVESPKKSRWKFW